MEVATVREEIFAKFNFAVDQYIFVQKSKLSIVLFPAFRLFTFFISIMFISKEGSKWTNIKGIIR